METLMRAAAQIEAHCRGWYWFAVLKAYRAIRALWGAELAERWAESSGLRDALEATAAYMEEHHGR
jgi:hypothetical protein